MSASAVDRMLQIVADAVQDPRVIAAMRAVPREQFVPRRERPRAYADAALDIGQRQTISQPLIVGMMTEALELQGDEHVLEIGTGSGYQTAILARLAADVVTVERIDALRARADEALRGLGCENVRCMAAGEVLGAAEHAPYDAVIVTAAAPGIPESLLEQLRSGGRIVIPVGSRGSQDLIVATKTAAGTTRRSLGLCRFVPLIGAGGFTEP